MIQTNSKGRLKPFERACCANGDQAQESSIALRRICRVNRQRSCISQASSIACASAAFLALSCDSKDAMRERFSAASPTSSTRWRRLVAASSIGATRAVFGDGCLPGSYLWFDYPPESIAGNADQDGMVARGHRTIASRHTAFANTKSSTPARCSWISPPAFSISIR
jgi:hypothetical protein